MSQLPPWSQPVISELIRLDASDSLPHAILLQANEIASAEAVAEAFAQNLLGDNTGLVPDYHRVTPEEGKQTISIDSIREVIAKVHTTAFTQRKVVLLSPSEGLARAGANALLKTLEAPPPATTFLLTCAHVSQLLPTIISRCQRYTVPTPTRAMATSWLETEFDAGRVATALEMMGENVYQAKALLANEEDAGVLSLWHDLDALKLTNWTELTQKWQKLPLISLADLFLRKLYLSARQSMIGSKNKQQGYFVCWDTLCEVKQQLLNKVPLSEQSVIEKLTLSFLKFKASQ